MSTYGDLKQNVYNSLNRDDLVDAAIVAVEDAIKHHQRNFFYETPQTDQMSTVIGQGQYDIPDDMVSVQWIRLDQSGVWHFLRMVEYREILIADTLVIPVQSVPSMWASFDNGFRLYNVPDKIYTLELTGNGFIPIPTDDADENFWTNDAEQLIRYTALAKLYRIRIGNYDRAAMLDSEAEKFRKQLWKQTFEVSSDRRIAGHW